MCHEFRIKSYVPNGFFDSGSETQTIWVRGCSTVESAMEAIHRHFALTEARIQKIEFIKKTNPPEKLGIFDRFVINAMGDITDLSATT